MSEVYFIMRGKEVTGWCEDGKFARACAGVGERVVKLCRCSKK